jgi:phage terminase small subunit
VPGLTPKQSLFVAEYLKDLNGTAAAKRAGYSDRTSEKMAYQNLHLVPAVKEAVEEALKRRSARVEVKADDVLRELIRVMTVDVARAFDVNGRLLPLQQMPEDVRRAIASFEVEESLVSDTVVRKVKFLDKMRAVELGMKHLGLLIEKVKVEGTITLEQLVTASFQKPDGGA